jgi:uncharacterized damage-inducible protein DinB
MTSAIPHDERIAATVAAFEAAMDRFVARIEQTPDEVAERHPGEGWTVAGITWHVAVTNEAFAGLVDGSIPLAKAPAADFAETPFLEITAQVPDQLEAPEKFHPPDRISKADALARVRASRDRLVNALGAMSAERGLWTVKSILGQISVYQVGDWAIAHVIRHNAQVKRVAG